MHTHTRHWPDIHQVISELHKIKRPSFCPFPLSLPSLSPRILPPIFCHEERSRGSGGGKVFGKQKEPVQQASVSLCACEVDIGISCLGFSCGVHLVGRVGNSCLHHSKVSRLGLTVSVSVQRKESILLDYGCALRVKQQTCSV